MAAITDSKVLADFAIERQEGITVRGTTYLHPDDVTGKGLEETCTYDCEIEANCKIQGRYIFRFFDDGLLIKKKYFRHEIVLGVPTIYGCVMGKALAEKLHTPEVIAEYKAKIAEAALGPIVK